MTDLVACVGASELTWKYLEKLIDGEQWSNVFLISGINNYNIITNKKINKIIIDNKIPLQELIEEIRNKLDNKITDTDVALNLISGSGKEHMAIMSALLKLGLGIRLVALTAEGVKEV